jgi:hypothetical protein
MANLFQSAGKRNTATLHVRQTSQAMTVPGRLAEHEDEGEGVDIIEGMAYLVGR